MHAPPADPPTVLVVDDEPDIRDLIRLNLEASGYQVVTAGDGDEALQAARRARPDVVFLDVLMPGLDGWAVLERLKADDAGLAAVPVVMVTALAQTEERLRGAIEGAVRYLTKPFHPNDLVAVVDELLAPGAPGEEELRREVRNEALERLARIEAGAQEGMAAPAVPRVRLTRLERDPVPSLPPARLREARARMPSLTDKQRDLLLALREAGSVSAVAAQLRTSRSNVYASLRRVVHRLGLRNTTELLRLLAEGRLLDG